jgi:hypothetical protein
VSTIDEFRVSRMQRFALAAEEDALLLLTSASCPGHEMKDKNGKDVDNSSPPRFRAAWGKYTIFPTHICNTLGAGQRCITCDVCCLHVHVSEEQ